MKSINRKIANSKRFQRNAMRSIQKGHFENQKKKALSKFNNHPVTQEINGGASASSSIQELKSIGGNLFTFIGFHAGSDPIAPVRAAIEKLIRIKFPKFYGRGRHIEVSYNVSLPTLSDLDPVSPMPWGGGSWLQQLEKGISGFDSYLYQSFPKGRSRMATQAKVSGVRGRPRQEIRGAGDIRRTYITQVLEEFKREFRKR
jgi:hypothetical protein